MPEVRVTILCDRAHCGNTGEDGSWRPCPYLNDEVLGRDADGGLAFCTLFHEPRSDGVMRDTRLYYTEGGLVTRCYRCHRSEFFTNQDELAQLAGLLERMHDDLTSLTDDQMGPAWRESIGRGMERFWRTVEETFEEAHQSVSPVARAITQENRVQRMLDKLEKKEAPTWHERLLKGEE